MVEQTLAWMCKNEREHGIEGGGSERERDLIGMNMAFNVKNTVARRISAIGAKKRKAAAKQGDIEWKLIGGGRLASIRVDSWVWE
jgi:hypothetical protein